MKKFISGFILGSILFTSIPAIAQGISKTIKVVENGVILKVNGQKINQVNYLINNTTYVPLRVISESLGQKVNWDSNTKTVDIGSNPSPASNTAPATTPAPTPTPTPIPEQSPTQTPSENAFEEQYKSFKAMFTFGEKIYHPDGGDLTSKATYNGQLDKEKFFEYWNSMDKSAKETLAKKLGEEVQSVNPKLNVAIDFWYEDIKLGYVIAYSEKYQLCSFLDNHK